MMTNAEQDPRLDEVASATPGRRRRKPLRLLVSLAIAAALLVLVVWLADFEDLLERLRSADVVSLLFSAVAYICTYVARARRFATAGAKASTWTLFWVVTIHGALNRLMPLRTGELAYPMLAKRVGAAALGEGLVQLLMLRLLDLVTVAVLFLTALMISLASGLAGLGGSTWAFVTVACGIGVAALAALWKLGALLEAVVRISRRVLTWTGTSGRGRVQDLLEKASEAVSAVTDLTTERRLRLGFWSVTCWGAYFVTFYYILVALSIDLPFLRTVLGSSAAIVGSTVPISGLGTFGALEGGWTAGFVAVGVEPSTAASTALVMSGLTLLFAVVLAAFGWVVLGSRGRLESGADRER